MRISELISNLKLVLAHSGDIETVCLTSTHSFPPQLLVKRIGDKEYLILND